MYDHPRQMEPMFPGESPKLVDLAMEVYRKSASLDDLLHPVTRKEVIRICEIRLLLNSLVKRSVVSDAWK